MENPFIRNPLQVTIYDVPSASPIRSFMFLGNVPKNVLEAARRGVVKGNPDRITLAPLNLESGRSAWPKTSWSKIEDMTILKRFYGSRWKYLLTPRIGTILGPRSYKEEQVGGDSGLIDFGNLSDFDDVDIVIEESDLENDPSSLTEISSTDGSSMKIDEATFWDPKTTYSDISVYPEDTFSDLKSKIYVATGIPPFRQHIFYPVGNDDGEPDEWGRSIRTIFRIILDGSLVLVDIRRFSQEMYDKDRKDMVAGLPVDRSLEEKKEEVRIDAFDMFRTLEEFPGYYVKRIFVADLATLFRVRKKELFGIVTDRYQFDLLYYGMILKYWPTLSSEAFRMIIVSPDTLSVMFPLLDPSIERVKNRLDIEREIIDNIYSQSSSRRSRLEKEEKKGGIAVVEASVIVEPKSLRSTINLRNIFDWLPATREVPSLIARIPSEAIGEHNPSLIHDRRSFVFEKSHVSSVSPKISGTLESLRSRRLRRPGVSCAIIRETSNGERHRRTPEGQPRFVYLTLYSNGKYVVESSWREDDRIGFDEVIHQLSIAAQPLIDSINEMGAAAFPLGGSLETPLEVSKEIGNRAFIDGLVVSTFWPHALTTDGFREMKNRWREYEKARIAGIRGLQQTGAYTFRFRKGITKYDPRAMERVVSKGIGSSSINRQIVNNHYAYLTDPSIAQRWQYVFTGRLVHVHHRTTDLKIEIVGVDIEEFRRIQLYIFVFLDGLVYGPNKLSHGVVQLGKARPTEGRLRSLQERDPYRIRSICSGGTRTLFDGSEFWMQIVSHTFTRNGNLVTL